MLNGSWIAVWTMASPTSELVQLELHEHEEQRREQGLVGDDQAEQQDEQKIFLAEDCGSAPARSRRAWSSPRQNRMVSRRGAGLLPR